MRLSLCIAIPETYYTLFSYVSAGTALDEKPNIQNDIVRECHCVRLPTE